MKTRRHEEFRSYVVDHRAELVRTATLMAAGDRHLAEDVVQSALTRLYLAWPAFRRAGNPRAYAHRTLYNALVDERRRPWRRRERSTADLPEPPAGKPGGNDRADLVVQALRELPTRMRAALVFRYLEDLSVADTAEVMGCAEGTVKSQTARALDRLRTILGDPDRRGDPAGGDAIVPRTATAPLH